MEVDADYPEEISSFAESKLGISDLVRNSSVKLVRSLNLLSPTKKRKFLAENKEQLQASKYIRSETFVECSKLFYAHTRKGKTPLLEMAESPYNNNQEDSTHDSNSSTGDSFSQCSDTKSSVYVKVNSYEESSSSSHSAGAAISGDAFCSMNNSTMVDEFEENVDEFGHCLEYLAAACEGDKKTGERDEDEDEDEGLLYSNDMSSLTSSECLIAEVTQLSMGKATIDQEFEQYFSTLML